MSIKPDLTDFEEADLMSPLDQIFADKVYSSESFVELQDLRIMEDDDALAAIPLAFDTYIYQQQHCEV
jgi:hypothetical protein